MNDQPNQQYNMFFPEANNISSCDENDAGSIPHQEGNFPYFLNNIYDEDELSVENLLPSLTSSDFKSTPWTYSVNPSNKSATNTFIDFTYLSTQS